MRGAWPRDEAGRLYRFDRTKTRKELQKIPVENLPPIEDLLAGVNRWKRTWDKNGFQHNASRFVSERLWEQSPTGKRPRSEQITARSLFKEGDA
jgi:hypothetical protein